MERNAKRRQFLKTAVAGAAVLAAGSLISIPRQSQAANSASADEAEHKKSRKWVMVIDLEKCDGCQKCTEACQTEHMVPPAWSDDSYNGKQEWIKVRPIGEDIGPVGPKGNFLPTPCMQCEDAPCVKVCPTGSTFHTPDGNVLINTERCVGCRYCIAACPYQRRYFNWGEIPLTEEEKAKLAFVTYSPEYTVPHKRGTAEKCMFCAHRTDEGKLPACVEECNKMGMKALYFGDMNEDAVSNGSEILVFSQLIKSRAGYRLKEELGTHPRVWYLPPKGK